MDTSFDSGAFSADTRCDERTERRTSAAEKAMLWSTLSTLPVEDY